MSGNRRAVPKDSSGLDDEVAELVVMMSRLHGLETTSSCSGHGVDALSVSFVVDPNDVRGLFMLARAADKRYWKYGHIWKIEVSANDVAWLNGHEILPVAYEIHSGTSRGQKAYSQASSLVESIEFHSKHKAFLRGYGLPTKLREPSDKILRLVKRGGPSD